MKIFKSVFLGFLVSMLSACATNATVGSVAPSAVTQSSADAGDEVTCRRERVYNGSRIRTQVCSTKESRREMERAQQRMREGIRRMQDAASNARQGM